SRDRRAPGGSRCGQPWIDAATGPIFQHHPRVSGLVGPNCCRSPNDKQPKTSRRCTVNRRELVGAVAAHSGVEPRQVDAVLKGFTDVVTAVVAKGEPVALSGFAKFAKVERPARMGRNPAT